MLAVPDSIMSTYVATLKVQEIPVVQVAYYQKWLRYFYDFSANLRDLSCSAEQLKAMFVEKLRSKNQSDLQCRQAAHAVALYQSFTKPVAPAGACDIQQSNLCHEEVNRTSKVYAHRKRPVMYTPIAYRSGR